MEFSIKIVSAFGIGFFQGLTYLEIFQSQKHHSRTQVLSVWENVSENGRSTGGGLRVHISLCALEVY